MLAWLPRPEPDGGAREPQGPHVQEAACVPPFQHGRRPRALSVLRDPRPARAPPGHRALARARDGGDFHSDRAAARRQGHHGARDRRGRAACVAPCHPHPHPHLPHRRLRPPLRATAYHHRHLPLPRHRKHPRQPDVRPPVRALYLRARALAHLLLRAGRRQARDDALHPPSNRDRGHDGRHLARIADCHRLPLPDGDDGPGAHLPDPPLLQQGIHRCARLVGRNVNGSTFAVRGGYSGSSSICAPWHILKSNPANLITNDIRG
mmetsp:Transcript_16363/g.41087  ORF Transcript_16363/g.41087 Transcript_16363/m.41087 type:complete len:264 (-) Transcript_16363:65-856(-)